MKSLYPRASRLLPPLAVVTAISAIIVDWVTPIRLNVSIIYIISLVLAGLARKRRLLWVLLIALLCSTFGMYELERAVPHAAGALLLQNRVLSAMTMLVVTLLLHFWSRSMDTVEQRDRQIRQQNEEVDQRRRQAEEASKRNTLLFASLSHDIRTPLSVINLTARAIGAEVSRAGTTDSLRTMAQRLVENTATLANQVTDILDFSTFELGHVDLHPCECMLGGLLAQLHRSLLPLAQAKGLELLLEPCADAICLRTDPVKLERVLTNLVMNSIKYTAHGYVRVSAGYSDTGGVRICVQDSGIGIAPDHIERIFDEFARLHTSVEGSQSWGLGLPICRRLITLMRGSIGVESRPGGGSTFIVQLPLSYDDQLPRPSDAGLPASPESLTTSIE